MFSVFRRSISSSSHLRAAHRRGLRTGSGRWRLCGGRYCQEGVCWLTAPGATASHRIVHDTQTMLLLNWARCRDGLKTILSRVRFDAHFTFSVFCCFFFAIALLVLVLLLLPLPLPLPQPLRTFDGGNVWSLCGRLPACLTACLPLCSVCCSVCLPRSERCEILALAFVARCSAPAL